jgi:HTH-type transcriptional regulator / antitoxin HipB
MKEQEQYVGQIIRFHRKKSGLSQKALAKLAEVGKTVVYDIEKGKISIRFDTLLKVMGILNIKITFQSQLMHLYEKEFYEKSPCSS